MQTIYPYVQLVHLVCAVIFVGYLFFDVVIFKLAKKSLSAETAQSVRQAISAVAIKIMPACVLALILTGGMMMSTWVGSKAGGYFSSPLQIVFMIKVILGFVIFFAVAINLTFKFALKRPSPLGDIHPFALIASAVIVIFAKIMFIV